MKKSADGPSADVVGVERYIRHPELLELLGVKRQTVYEWRRSGIFPEPVKLGPRIVAWPMSVVVRWQRERTGAR